MAPVLKIDGYEHAPQNPLQPGEGMDPADNDFLQPQFSDAAGGEGDPLISLGERNRELAFPLTLNPAKAGYAASKDGLHQLVRDLQRRVKGLLVLEWRDDGATSSSFLDVVSARIEVDYNYRRAQHQWLQAVLRIWTKPFAHTATMRLIGTAVTHPTIRPAPAPSAVVASGLDGDEAADIDVKVSFLTAATSSMQGSGPLFAGVAVIHKPEAEIWLHPATLGGGLATVAGASGAAASQMLTYNLGESAGVFNGLNAVLGLDVENVRGWRPATGGVRLVALLRNRAATTLFVSAIDSQAFLVATSARRPLGPTQSLEAGQQWRVVDLGTIYDETAVSVYAGAASNATIMFDVGGMLRLPAARTFMVGKARDSSAASHFFGTASGGITIRRAGGTLAAGATVNLAGDVKVAGDIRPLVAASQPELVQGFAILDYGAQNGTVGVEVSVRERFTYHR